MEGQDLATRVEHLFETIVHPGTGEPYTNADVARMSAGALTVEDVEGMRTRRIADPTVGQVAALAAVFGVPPSYLVDRGQGRPVLDEEVMDALADETMREIIREALRLPERERGVVLGIVQQFADERATQGVRAGRGSEPTERPEAVTVTTLAPGGNVLPYR